MMANRKRKIHHHSCRGFKYCIHVDAESIKSVVENAPQPPAPDLSPVGYVNLIVADWTLDEDEDEDEIEGFTQRDDVGWMKVAVDGLAPRTYGKYARGE